MRTQQPDEARRETVSERPDRVEHPHIDVALARLAERQFGVFTFEQAVAVGIPGRVLSRRVKSRRLFRVHKGVYSLVPPQLLTDKGRLMAAVLAAGDGGGLSHLPAAIHTGFISQLLPNTLDVTVPTAGGRSRDDIRIHRSTLLRPQDVIPTYGIPTTTVARTILDLLGVMPEPQVEDAMDEANRVELLDIAELREQAAHNRTRPEAKKLTTILDHWDYLSSFTESQLEKLTLQGLQSRGLPAPELQQTIDLNDGGPKIRADFLYRDARLILEADSWRWHSHRLEQDSKRDQRAAAAGYQTLRITRRQVIDDLDRLAANVASVHEQRRALFSGRAAA